jgi:hypothetical protein
LPLLPLQPKNIPDGLTTHYEYDRFKEHPALIHNLTKIIDPSDQVVVENQYGNEPGSDDFGRVIPVAVASKSSFVAILQACVKGLSHNTSSMDQYNQSELYSLWAESINCCSS